MEEVSEDRDLEGQAARETTFINSKDRAIPI
jgi:hypothetical protein